MVLVRGFLFNLDYNNISYCYVKFSFRRRGVEVFFYDFEFKKRLLDNVEIFFCGLRNIRDCSLVYI